MSEQQEQQQPSTGDGNGPAMPAPQPVPPAPASAAQPASAAGTATATVVAPAPALAPKEYYASIYPGPSEKLPQPFVDTVIALEATLGVPLWLYVQDGGDGTFDQVNTATQAAFWAARAEMQAGQNIALLIDSPGGYARYAYQIATQLRRHCGDFTAVIPRYAKSAATLLALGAGTIIMNDDAELGPLDAQIFDPEREDWSSALNEVQTVERLHASALSLLDQTMLLLLSRTGKKVDSILPNTLDFVSRMMRPMFENIDVVRFTQRARDLKVAEDYAIRLLRRRYSLPQAELIGRRLVSAYPDHGFVIDIDETKDFCAPQLGISLNVTEPTPDQNRLLDTLVPMLGDITIMGRLKEVQTT